MNCRTPPLATLTCAMIIACSGGDPSSPETSGGAPSSPGSPASPGASGLAFEAKSAIHGIGPGGTTIVVSDAPDLCTTLSQQDARGAPQALGASFLRLAAAGDPPGSFSGSAVSALLVEAAQVVSSSGDGRVELDAESPDGLLSGSYDLGGAGVSGQFTTRRCAALDAGAGDASFSSPQSCRVSTRTVDDRSEYDERCTLDGQTRSRECTLSAGESTWSCLCTAASGTRSTCESHAAQAGIDTPPPNCCPGG